MDINQLRKKVDAFLRSKVVPLDQKIKIAICAGACIVPVALYFFFGYSPNTKKIKQLKREKTSIEQKLAEVKARAGDLDKHKEDMKQTGIKFKQASLLLPQTKEIPSLLTNISSLGTKSGLDMISFQPGGEVPKEFYAEIPVSISVRGPYHNVGYFLYQVSKLDRIVSVANIGLDSPTLQDGEMILRGRLSLVTYKFIEKPVEDEKKK
jgi:type IV pilus assembly protein PilO